MLLHPDSTTTLCTAPPVSALPGDPRFQRYLTWLSDPDFADIDLSGGFAPWTSSGLAGIHDASCPRTIYHVVQQSVWDKAQRLGAQYYPPTYVADGFIHATSEAEALIGVLNNFYKQVNDAFLCLAIDTAVLTSPVKVEQPAPVGAVKPNPSDGTPVLFPHIYGPLVPPNCVVRQLPVTRDPDGSFVKIEGL